MEASFFKCSRGQGPSRRIPEKNSENSGYPQFFFLTTSLELTISHQDTLLPSVPAAGHFGRRNAAHLHHPEYAPRRFQQASRQSMLWMTDLRLTTNQSLMMNPLHLKAEQNKQVKQLWSGARDIFKRSEQPHSGQLIGGSFLKKTLIEADREWKWMNERKRWQSGNKKRTFFVSFEDSRENHRKTASILETSSLDRFRLQLGSGLFSAIYHARVAIQHVSILGSNSRILHILP